MKDQEKAAMVMRRTGEDEVIVITVLGYMGGDVLAACSTIDLARFYEMHPVDLAQDLRNAYSFRYRAKKPDQSAASRSGA